MPCDFPLKGYRSATERGPSGKPLIVFNPLKAMNSTQPLEIPCNNCMGCKLERAGQWATRMTHEATFHSQNCFLTLTYSDEAVPENFGLDLRHLQLFMKRLRKSLPQKVRFFACGEYGDLNLRPHYHLVVFGWDPPGQVWHSTSDRGDKQYTSPALTKLWDYGLATTGQVTFESCRYVASYVTKKLNNWADTEAYRDRYVRVSPITGELHSVRQEFAVMSRRPGIGQAYVDKFRSEFQSGYIIVKTGKGYLKRGLPRYYKSKLSEGEQRQIKLKAKKEPRSEKTMERRQARAAVRDARITKLQRKL